MLDATSIALVDLLSEYEFVHQVVWLRAVLASSLLTALFWSWLWVPMIVFVRMLLWKPSSPPQPFYVRRWLLAALLATSLVPYALPVASGLRAMGDDVDWYLGEIEGIVEGESFGSLINESRGVAFPTLGAVACLLAGVWPEASVSLLTITLALTQAGSTYFLVRKCGCERDVAGIAAVLAMLHTRCLFLNSKAFSRTGWPHASWSYPSPSWSGMNNARSYLQRSYQAFS